MKLLKTMRLATLLLFSTFTLMVSANETITEKVKVKANDAKRIVRKGANRVEEAVCVKGDIKCNSMKVKNRILEAKDATVDGVKKIKNKID